ncbi:hypothetical protein ACVIHB_001561 [Bradyrhizobium liaoningense]
MIERWPAGDAFDHHRARVLREALAGERGEQFVLPVARDAGDAEDLAALQLERDVLKPHTMRVCGGQRKIIDHEPRHCGLAAGCGLHFLDLSADHHPCERGRGLEPRVAGLDLPAAAQDSRGVTEALHLLQLVADIEDGAAFGLEPLQHDEELICLLRRQHRGGLVQDQEFRILHQGADDLDALALADGQLPDFALGIERQSIGLRHLLQPRRHVLEGLFAVEAERDVLGDGKIVEQREMLEYHTDAKAACFRGTGKHDWLALPADLAGAGLDQPVDGLDQRRLAGAVLAEQGVNFTRPDVDVDGIVGEEIAITLGEADRPQERGIAGLPAVGRRI